MQAKSHGAGTGGRFLCLGARGFPAFLCAIWHTVFS